MDDRRGAFRDRLPEASEGFTEAILAGGEAIRRHENRRGRVRRIALVAAAFALLAVGLGAAIHRLGAPKPDNVVLSVNPDSVVTEEEKARLRATASPEPTREPEEDAKSWIDPDSGWEYLLDDGPFEPGEWLVVTDSDGCLSYGLIVSFLEQPSDQARSIHMVPGMQVRYLGDAGNRFSRVIFAGTEGYVATQYLRRGAPMPELEEGRSWVISEADLYLTDSLGEVHHWLVDDNEPVATYALQKLLEQARPIEDASLAETYADEPLGALLLLRMQDADEPLQWENGTERFVDVRYAMSRGGLLLFQGEDGSRRQIFSVDGRFFWSIFPEAEEWVW